MAALRTVHAPGGMVCSVDHLASSAGVALLRAGGTAADAAVAASAVLAVTTQHMCGMGGDLFALVGDGSGPPTALAAAGRAGSGADAEAMRAEGLAAMPFRDDVRSVTVPGCVDGWLALHARHGRLPLADVLEPARRYAEDGFPASPLLASSSALIAEVAGAGDFLRPGGLRAGDRVRRPLVAAALAGIAAGGREAFYGGDFGVGLRALGEGLFAVDDLARDQAVWEEPLSVRAWGHDVWTVPPPSQGYLALAGAAIASGLDLPDDPDDPAWAHLLSEAARVAGADRLEVLFDGANGHALLDGEQMARRRATIDPARRSAPGAPTAGGGTIYLCAVDGEGMGVSLIQSNAAGWGAHLVVPGTGIFLQNRGIGFSLAAGHPAELAPGRRPPHTLLPVLVTGDDGSLVAVLGTMGGDIQPQVVLQLLARILHHGESPGRAVGGSRWSLGDGGFTTWEGAGPQPTTIEASAPDSWEQGLASLGHDVVRARPGANLGHAHAIVVGPDGMLAGAADPRALTGAAVGL
ncbi:MAG TPA: gamma-glutamyltransferase [Acidimicrobiales bacterium]|nr:gamma-glutamyltransferase [Acidimicrobiales bacterium]